MRIAREAAVWIDEPELLRRIERSAGSDIGPEICRSVDLGRHTEVATGVEKEEVEEEDWTGRALAENDNIPEQISSLVRSTIDALIQEEAAQLDLGHWEARPGNVRDQFLVQALGSHPSTARRVAGKFHTLPRKTRRAFHSVLVQHVPPKDFLRREGGWDSPRELMAGLVDVIATLRMPQTVYDPNCV